MSAKRANEILLDLSKIDLDLLEWLAAWTPTIHRAEWDVRKTWPPGFREAADRSLPGFSSKRSNEENLRKRKSWVPHKAQDLPKLLGYRLVEGAGHVVRLTSRGRAALKHHKRVCPDQFVSHCEEIFDNVSLLPKDHLGFTLTVLHDSAAIDPKDAPDTADTWRKMLVEYREADYQGRHTLSCANAHIGTASTNHGYLNGSIRQHQSVIFIQIEDDTGHRVCEVFMSHEQFADLLVGQSQVPVTMGYHFGHDGMMREQPAPKPISPYTRMRARLDNADDEAGDHLKALALYVEANEGKIGKARAAEIMGHVNAVAGLGTNHGAFIANQAIEEVSAAVESLATIAADRVGMLGGGADKKLLTANDMKRALMLGTGEATPPGPARVKALPPSGGTGK